MSVAGAIESAWTRLVAVPAYERDPGFREVVLRLSRNGMQVICLLGIGSVVFYTTAHLLLISADVTWAFRAGDAPRSVTLWDKLLIIGFSLLSLLVARSPLQGRGGRLVVALILLAVEVALLVDDAARGSLSNSPIYLLILMLCGVGTMPYKPRHMVLICVAITGVYMGIALLYVDSLGITSMETITRRVTTLIIAAIICTGIAALLYRSRYEQYLALKESEALKDQVMRQSERFLEAV